MPGAGQSSDVTMRNIRLAPGSPRLNIMLGKDTREQGRGTEGAPLGHVSGESTFSGLEMCSWRCVSLASLCTY